MEPIDHRARRTGMRRIALTFAALVLPLSLVGCGSGDGDDDVATDPGPASSSSSASESPTAEPTVGTYPEFESADYTYTLAVSCFCMGAGLPIDVTVAGGEVTGAVYAADDTGRSGVKAGDPADKTFWLTINDIIEKANDTEAAQVDVDWPAGQDYPNSVSVDGDKLVADDEVGYTISNVQES